MKRKNIFEKLLTMTIILLAFCSIALGQTEDKLYRIAVLTEQNSEKCLERWKDTADYLTEEIENASFIIIPLNAEKINLAAESGRFDFFIVNPAIYVNMAVKYDIEALATLKTTYMGKSSKLYGTTIFTKTGRDDINTIEDLKDKSIIATNENSLGGFIFAKKEFLDAKINYPDDFKRFVFGGIGEHVVYAVSQNVADVGIVRTGILEDMEASGKINISDFKLIVSKNGLIHKGHNSFALLHSANLYPEWPFAKAEHISNKIAEKILLALMSIKQDNLYAVTGKYANWAAPMSYQSVEDCLKQLKIAPYQNYGIITSRDLFAQHKAKVLIISATVIGMFIAVVVISLLNSNLKKSQNSLKTEMYERKRITDKLKQSEQRFTEIAENASEWIWEVDTQGLFIYSSPAVEEILGYSADELVGKKYFYDFFAKDNHADNKEAALELFAKKENIKNFFSEYEHKDGHQVYLSTNGISMFNEQGQLIGYRGSDIDITKQRLYEKELINSRQDLMTMINSIPFGVVVIGKDKKIKRVNEAAVKMTGFDSKEEFVGQLCYKTLCPALANKCPILDENQNIDHSEKVLVKKDKTRISILKSVIPINLDGEEVLLECFVDIAERKDAEESLKHYVSLLKTTLDSTADGILVVDNQGKIVNLNTKFKQLWEIPDDAFNIGKGNKIIEKILSYMKEPELFLEKVKYLYRNPEEVNFEEIELNNNKVLECYSQPHTIDDEVIGRVWCFRDITDKKNAEEEKISLLERAKIQENAIYQLSVNKDIIAGNLEKGLKKITEIASEVMSVERTSVWLFNENQQQLRCCDLYEASTSKHSTEASLNTTDFPIYFEAIADGKTIEAVDAKNDPRTCEFTKCYLEPLGINSMFDLAIRVSGKIVGVLCYESVGVERKFTCDEITFATKISDHLAIVFMNASKTNAQRDLELLNAELSESNKELQNFIYVASHDLREPLRKISAFGNLLKASLENKLEDDDGENLEFMIEGASRLSKMIEGLLTYSRISSTACTPEDIDLSDTVEQIKKLELAVLLEKTDAKIEIPKPLPSIKADPTQIYQLFQNIISNSIKFQPQGSTPNITITSKPAANGMTKIEITDNGIGIKPEYQQAIFNMFKRMNTKEKYKGTGIGLSICKKIVEHYNGTIGVESQPEKGTTLWFTLPMAVAKAEITV